MGTLFEDLFSEMREGAQRQNGGSSKAIDVLGLEGIRYSLKTISLDTSLSADKIIGCKDIFVPIASLAKDKLVGVENIRDILIPYYNKISESIDRQVFLVRLTSHTSRQKNLSSQFQFIYFEQNFSPLDGEKFEIIHNENAKKCHAFKSDINLISIPKKITWNSASQNLRVYYRIPENADVITINRSEKFDWKTLVEKIK